DSPSGLGRTLGKRVGGNPSRVRISHPPPPLTCDDALGSCPRAALHATACVSFSVSVETWVIYLIPGKPVWWHAEMTHVVPGQGRGGRTRTEAGAPLGRAYRRSGQAGTVRRPGCRLLLRGAGCRQVTDRITLIEKFEENARRAQMDRSGQSRGPCPRPASRLF